MNTNELQIGQMYRIKEDVAIKICTRPMTYKGTETYRGVTGHLFWDDMFRLGHWIDPDEVEPA